MIIEPAYSSLVYDYNSNLRVIGQPLDLLLEIRTWFYDILYPCQPEAERIRFFRVLLISFWIIIKNGAIKNKHDLIIKNISIGMNEKI